MAQNAFCDIPVFSEDETTCTLKQWINSIKLAIQINEGWSMEKMMTLIRARVAHSASRKMDSIPTSRQFANADELIATLRSLFADSSSADARLEELYRFGQKPNESIGQLGDRVRNIISAVSPDNFDENMAIRAFISAIKNGNVKFDLRRNTPPTLSEAVAKADSFNKEWETCFNAPQVAVQGPLPPNPFQQQPRYQFQQPEPMEIDQQFMQQSAKCYYCQKQGHMAANCMMMKQHLSLIRQYEARIAGRGRGRTRGRGRGGPTRGGPARRGPLRFSNLPKQLRERDVQEIKDAVAQIQNDNQDDEYDENVEDVCIYEVEEEEGEEQEEQQQPPEKNQDQGFQ